MSDLGACTRCKRGVTLVELLVVIGIMILLVAIAVPTLRPLTEGRKTREASRGVNVFFQAARSRAIKTGRPVGVMFDRLARHPQACTLLRQAEVPPPYSGNVEGAIVRVMDYTYIASTDTWPYDPFYWDGGWPVLKVMVRDVDFSSGLIQHGDAIQLNHQGPWYTIEYDTSGSWPASFPRTPPGPSSILVPDFLVDANGYIDFDSSGETVDTDVMGNGWITSRLLTLTLDRRFAHRSPYPEARLAATLAGGGDVWRTPVVPPAVPRDDPLPRVEFQIYRQPVPSASATYQLPRGTVVDLAASGFDSQLPDSGTEEVAHTFEPVPTSSGAFLPVVVLFSSTGSVQQVYYGRRTYDYSTAPASFTGFAWGGRAVVEPIHFLVGKEERMPVALRDISVAPPATMPAPLADDGLYNRQDATNLWVALNPKTGLVTVAELSVDPPDPATGGIYYLPSGSTLAKQLENSRRFAREAQVSKGGR